MRHLLAAVALLALAAATNAQAAEPRIGPERLIMRTIAGDIVLALYPDVAPNHVAQILKLARAGVYDTTHFYRVEPGFLIQLSTAADRLRPMEGGQQSLLHPLAAELSPLRHQRGVLSMARDIDLNSAESSFSILLGDAPHLDGKYTIFGHVEGSGEVLDAIAAVAVDTEHRPRTRVTVNRLEVLDSPDLVAKASLAPARQIIAPPLERSASDSAAPVKPLVVGLILIIGIGAVAVLGARRIPPRAVTSLLCVIVLVAAFLLFLLLMNHEHRDAWAALAVFVGLLAVLKLMGQ
ncbi:MAG TPA: peptidylprolyl isomerase, partial [Polyangia bacterium]|nr:peptidylprolyl isomerase [Polyangia bacterium]